LNKKKKRERKGPNWYLENDPKSPNSIDSLEDHHEDIEAEAFGSKKVSHNFLDRRTLKDIINKR